MVVIEAVSADQEVAAEPELESVRQSKCHREQGSRCRCHHGGEIVRVFVS
jgi:hypothetical protein